METYIEPKELAENPHYQSQRQKNLAVLSNNMIDEPIIEIVNDFNKLSYCFTLQSCYGHFLYNGQKNPYNLEPLPTTEIITKVKYKIAYLAFCIENSISGQSLFDDLNEIPLIDPKNIQFCCAEWFWKRQVNSYALQVEPERYKHKDSVIIDYNEALIIENIRNKFFIQLKELLKKHHGRM